MNHNPSVMQTSELLFTLATFGLFVGVGAGLAHLGLLVLTSWPVLIGLSLVAAACLLWRFRSPALAAKSADEPLVIMPPAKSTYR